MARSRSLTTEFIKLLNATESPLYAVDDQWRLIFVNAACAAWVEIEAEALQGQVCRYHSAECATAGEAVAAALCPPPETMQGYRISAEVGIRVAGTARIRRCEFHPLLDASGGVVGVLGFLAGTDGKTDADQIDHKEENWHVTLRRHRETLRGRYQVDQILGESAAMRRVRRQVELAVGSRARVLIVGSESTGRRHVARAIHYARGGEADDTLVPLACSLLDREMLRTAWNSLRWTQKQDETRHMVVLLEDVDQLSEAGQADLARWLRDDSGMRVLATSQQKLDQLVDEGRYVAELAEALGTLVIEIPPLASRPEDIPLLAQALLETINAEGTKQLSGCTPEALDRLSAYTWPGNLEELAEILKSAHERATGVAITQRDLPDHVRLSDTLWRDRQLADEPIVLDEFLLEIERRLLERAMARSGGNKTKAAHLLGVSRPRLYRRLVQLGFEPEASDEEQE